MNNIFNISISYCVRVYTSAMQAKFFLLFNCSSKIIFFIPSSVGIKFDIL